MGILCITSPAKTMDESVDWKSSVAGTISQPRLDAKTGALLQRLRKLDQTALQKLLQVSDNITVENYQRFQSWQELPTKPSILLYNGAIYKMLNASEWSANQQQHAQATIRIISGLYGLLRPYDVMRPYRLEMRTKIPWLEQSLAAWWSDSVTTLLQRDAAEQGVSTILNLASVEYRNTIDTTNLKTPIISIHFKERKQGKLKTVAMYAKKARGAMLEWIVQQQIDSVEDLRDFSELGYSLQKKTATELLFVR
jgi:cytoplasmic iron level regulating protein YaaA (DUF328/UPF0246 family)